MKTSKNELEVWGVGFQKIPNGNLRMISGVFRKRFGHRTKIFEREETLWYFWRDIFFPKKIVFFFGLVMDLCDQDVFHPFCFTTCFLFCRFLFSTFQKTLVRSLGPKKVEKMFLAAVVCKVSISEATAASLSAMSRSVRSMSAEVFGAEAEGCGFLDGEW